MNGACNVCGNPIVRVGTDLQEASAVENALREHGARYLDRVYTGAEQMDSLGRVTGGERRDLPPPGSPWPPAAVSALAGRYAVKEAVAKVLRPADAVVPWLDVEVVRSYGGWCTLALYRQASQRATEAGLSGWDVSFSHDGSFAVATVVAVHGCGFTAAGTPGGS